MINKKISQFIEVTELDTTAYIPLIQGSPLYNAIIKPEEFASELTPTLDTFYIKVDGTNSNLDILKFNTALGHQNLLSGQLAYNHEEGVLELGMNGGDVQQSIGLEFYVRYKATENILNGQLLMYDGTDGNSGVIKLKKATVNCDPKLIYGIATEDAQNGGLHFATWYGKIKDINTSMYQSGNDLYQSTTTAGALQSTEPSAPHNKASYAKVINAHSSQGTLFVRINRSVSMNDINDVQVTNPTNGQALAYEDGVWKNKSSLGITDISPVGGSLNIAGTTVVEDLEADNVQSTGGFVKPLHDDTEILLAGGGTKEISDFQLKSEKGVANGYASLGADGLVPTTQLPSYVDDVLEFANLAAFPIIGETGKIYVAKDTNKAYRWSGSVYTYITSGAVDSVAGKTGVVTLNKSDVGLGNVDNTSDLNKPISTATQAALNGKVNNTGNETIAGVKTFSSLPKIPLTPLANEDAASKAYADGQANAALTLAQKYAENPEDVAVETGKYSAKHYSLKAAASAAGIADSAEMLIKHEAEIASLENTINSANINQETTATVTGVDTVALPKTAANTGMQVQLFGQSAENLVVNGDFRNGTTGWSQLTAGDGILSVVDGILNNTVTALKAATVAITVILKPAVNDKIYIAANVKGNANVLAMGLYIGGGASAVPAGGQGWINTNLTIWQRVSAIATVASTTTGGAYFAFRSSYDPANTGGYITYMDNAMAINLTATFGAGNEPTKEQCDILFANYFEGSDNVLGTGRISSPSGKNLFNKLKIIPNTGVNSSGGISSSTNSNASDFIPVRANTQYSMSGFINTYIAYYNVLKQFISIGTVSVGYSTITTPANTAFVRFSIGYSNMNTLQFEAGSTATAYEPYRQSSLYLTTPELRSNGLIKDEIRKGTNGYELVKRVGVGTLGAEKVAPYDFTTWTNVGNITAKTANSFTLGASGSGVFKNLAMTTGKWYRISISGSWSGTGLTVSDTNGAIGRYYYIGANAGSFSDTRYFLWAGNTSVLIYGVGGTGTLTVNAWTVKEVSAAEAIAATSTFTEIGSNVHFTLATPAITPIQHAGLLNSNSNGTTYFEPIIADAGVYSSNLAIQLTDYPISSFESIRKYENGTYTELNTATAVIASGGLSFTHPDLVSGDLVMFTYAYNKESIGRSMTLTHYDSRFVEADTANGKVYRIVPVVTNGVVSWTAVEV